MARLVDELVRHAILYGDLPQPYFCVSVPDLHDRWLAEYDGRLPELLHDLHANLTHCDSWPVFVLGRLVEVHGRLLPQLTSSS